MPCLYYLDNMVRKTFTFTKYDTLKSKTKRKDARKQYEKDANDRNNKQFMTNTSVW